MINTERWRAWRRRFREHRILDREVRRVARERIKQLDRRLNLAGAKRLPPSH